MKHCISYWSMPQGLENTHPIDDALARARAADFDGIELCIATEGALSVDTQQAACDGFRSAAADAGLALETLASGMTWGANPVSNDADVRERSLAQHERALERAGWLGCDAMLYIPGIVNSPIAPGEHVRPDAAVARARENVKRLLDAAERHGVTLALENVWNGLFYDAAAFCDFIDSFGSDRLGAYLDVGNLIGIHQWPPHWIEMLGHRVARVHVKDFSHSFDWQGTYDFCMLGEGDVPWRETMTALSGIGYDRTLTAEMLPHREGLLADTRAALRRVAG